MMKALLKRGNPRPFAARLLTACLIALLVGLAGQLRAADQNSGPTKRIAAVVTAYFQNSHADVICSRLLQSLTLDGKGERPNLQLVSLYIDQPAMSEKGISLAKEYGFPLHDTVRGALTLGTDKLAVDGVLLVAEHGSYPQSATGGTQYPKRRLFSEVAAVMEESGKSVPVFIDKHLSDNWTDAKWVYDTARRLEIPLMAGSSLPQAWRYPAVNVPRDAKLKEVLVISYHTLDAYGFHAIEAMQSLVERRQGGETGIKSISCLTGEEVWKAADRGEFDPQLFQDVLDRRRDKREGTSTVRAAAIDPSMITINYADGLKAHVLTLNGPVAEFAAGWSLENGERSSTLLFLQEGRPFMHFSHLVRGVEKMMFTGQPTWAVERTLFSSGILDAALISQSKHGEATLTPYLEIPYQSNWDWAEPPPPPPDRASDQQ